MVVKMNFLSITGPKDDIERIAGQYLSKYEIQLENALTELKTVHDQPVVSGDDPTGSNRASEKGGGGFGGASGKESGASGQTEEVSGFYGYDYSF